jgi:hypothetical protein
MLIAFIGTAVIGLATLYICIATWKADVRIDKIFKKK